MKKPLAITLSFLAVFIIAIIVAFILSRPSDSQGPPRPSPVDPLNPHGVVQNLQAPAPPFNIPGDARIAALINDLANDDFNKRIAAADALKQLGAAALPQLQIAAQQFPDDDVRLRCKTIIKAIGEAPVIAQQQAANPLGALGAAPGAPANLGGLEALLGGGGGAPGGDLMGLLLQMMGGLGNVGPRGAAGGDDLNALLGQLLGGAGGAGRRGALGGGALGADLNALLAQMLGGMGGMGAGDLNAMLGPLLGGAPPAGAGGLGGLDGLLAQLGQLQGAIGGAGAPIGRPPPAPPPQDLSINLLDTFGARLGESGDGLRVLELRANTPAARSGMQTGDVITHINDREIKGRDDIVEALQSADRSKPLKIGVLRRGDLLTLTSQL
jgi:hypothetical protein